MTGIVKFDQSPLIWFEYVGVSKGYLSDQLQELFHILYSLNGSVDSTLQKLFRMAFA